MKPTHYQAWCILFAIIASLFEILIQPDYNMHPILRFHGSDFFAIYFGIYLTLFINIKPIWATLICVTLLCIYEYCQNYIPTMTYDPLDLVAYILGGITLMILTMLSSLPTQFIHKPNIDNQ